MKYTNDRYSINKIFALLLVLAVVLSIPVSTAFASGDTRASTTTTTKHTTVSGCKDDKHSMPTGNIGRWFNSRSEVQAYVGSVMDNWSNKFHNGEITREEYYKNCPQGYKAWSCANCGKWTGNFTY